MNRGIDDEPKECNPRHIRTEIALRGIAFRALLPVFSASRFLAAPSTGMMTSCRRDYEYKRCGTANVFCGVEPRAGRHFTKVTPMRCSSEFADYLLKIAVRYPAADTIHLVMDNLSTHTRKALVERFGEKAGGWLWDRFTVHYTITRSKH